MSNFPTADVTERIIEGLIRTKTNEEFVKQAAQILSIEKMKADSNNERYY
jgi:hypothetical protein